MQNNQQQIHPAQAAQEFMRRCDLKGTEVEGFAETFNWLVQILEGEVLLVSKDQFEQSKSKQEKLETEIKDLHTELDDAYSRLGEKPIVVKEQLDVVDSETSD